VNLTKIDDDICFSVPHEIIEGGKFAYQTKYAEMWQNIVYAAEETNTLDKLWVCFAE
jgi:hypothetical protein